MHCLLIECTKEFNEQRKKRLKHINLFLTYHKKIDLRSSNKHVALQNLSAYCMWKNLRKQFKNNRLKKQFPREMINLSCQVVLILCQILKIVLNIS